MKLDALLGLIATSVQEAHKAVEIDSVSRFFDSYFDKSEEAGEGAVYTPKSVTIRLPGPDGSGEKRLYAPVAALVQQKNFNLDCVKLNLDVRVLEESGGELEVSAQGPAPQEGDGGPARAGTMEITMRCTDAPEGVARIETHLYGML